MDFFFSAFDSHENLIDACREAFLEETNSEGCYIFRVAEKDFVSCSSPMTFIEHHYIFLKALRTKTTIISKKEIQFPFGKALTSACIPLTNQTKQIGFVVLTNGTYDSLSSLKPLFISLKMIIETLVKVEPPPKARDLFLANMSHEIRTPLQGIVGYACLLSEMKCSNEQSLAIEKIKECSLNLVSIVNDILDFSKLSSGKMTVRLAECRMGDLISFVIETLRPRFQKRLIVPSICSNDRILSDRQKLTQIIMNLVSNAVKFTPENGRIDISVTRINSFVQCSVKDNGIGISRDEQNKLFRAFSQLGVQGEGSGLGLVISKKLCEILSGSISFTSFPGVGSEFIFKIPSANEVEPEEPPKEEGRLLSSESKILIVEDNQTNRELLHSMLEKLSFRNITEASDGIEALQCLCKETFDVALLDLRMPRLGGHDVAAEMKKKGCQTKIIITTASTSDDDQKRSVPYEFLRKPITIDQLRRSLSNK